MLGARCALVLAAFTAAAAHNECDSFTVGSSHGNSIQLPDVVLERNSRVFGLDLQFRGVSPCPPGSVLVGSTITACDWQRAPVVSMDVPTYAIVTRTNSLAQPAVAHTVVVCRPAAALPLSGAGAPPDWHKPRKRPQRPRVADDVQSALLVY